jgi:glycerol-3-phosphate dehydrogenase (NAD(P)+)
MKIVVLGAGAWGTALAIEASAAHSTSLWGRDHNQIAQMQSERTNTKYLKDIKLPDHLTLSSSALAEWLTDFDLIIIATPMSALREVLTKLGSLNITAPVVWLCKGFEAPRDKSDSGVGGTASKGLLGHEVLAEVAPNLIAGVLSGPSFAQEVALLQPTALVVASEHEKVRETLVQALHTDKLRIYATSDVVGVEVGGAVKNVMAIATGLCDGLELGLNARAALITRGLSEMTGLGVALGARAQTFMGLSGLGDLVLTTTGDLSRNRRVGLCLAKGLTLKDVMDTLGHVAEGVYSAKTVSLRAAELGVDMPITNAVVALLDGSLRAKDSVPLLMGRSAKDEALDFIKE